MWRFLFKKRWDNNKREKRKRDKNKIRKHTFYVYDK